MSAVSLQSVLAALGAAFGPPAEPLVTAPFEMALLESCAYLVDDQRRWRVFARLREEVGLDPEAILASPPERLAAVIADGGMRPEMRAEKLFRCAEIAAEFGVERLNAEARLGTREARRVLRRFPGIGEPGADRILLFNGSARTLAPDSNALRVLVRLGFAREEKDYGATYRAAVAATSASLPAGQAELVAAHQQLRRLGQSTCRRTAPDCPACPLSDVCPTAGAAR